MARHFAACASLCLALGGTHAADLRTIVGPHGQTYVLRAWQTEDGLPQNSISAITETSDGYLWIGTYGGVARFDGVHFESFDSTNAPGLADTQIVSLYAAPDGALWIGHYSGDVTRLAAGVFAAVLSQSSNRNQSVAGIGRDGAGRVWLLRRNGALESPEGDRVLQFPGLTSTPWRLSLVNGRDGALYVECDGRVAQLAEDTLRPLNFGVARYSDWVAGVGPGRATGLWIERDLRIQRWSADAMLETRGVSPWLTDTTLGSLRETPDGVLAVSTLDQGLYLIRPDRKALHLDQELGLPQNWIRCLGEDWEGNLWVGTASAGLAQLAPARVSVLNAPGNWQGCAVLSLHIAPDGALWAGTEGAGLYRWSEGSWTQFGPSNPVGLRFVWSIASAPDGRIWAGTWGNGLFRQSTDRFERMTQFDSAHSPVFALQYMPDDRALWIGCARGLFRVPDSAPDAPPETIVEVPNVCTFLRAPDGAIWFGTTDAGLGRLEHGAHRLFTQADGLASDSVQALHLDVDGTLWIGSADGGLSRLREGRFSNISSAQGLPSNTVCHIADDGRGYLWLSTHHGLVRVARTELHRCADRAIAQLSGLVLDRNDGLPTIELAGGKLASGDRSADGRLWFPTGKGVVSVDPQNLRLNATPPPVVLERLQIDNRSFDFAAGRPTALKLPPAHQRLAFEFTALSLTAPTKVLFRYRLEGVDDDWIEAGTKRFATYSHLPAGRYTFRVAACNNDGIWNNDGATLAFTVLPYFWQTWWFLSLAGLVATGMVAILARALFHRRMRRRIEDLQRRHAIERERSRIAQDIHDDVGASLTRIMMLAQSAPAPDAAPTGAETAPARTTMQRIYAAAHDVTTSLDEIVWAVNPRHDSLDSLVSYMLGEFARSLLAEAGLRCRLDLPVAIPHWPLGAEVRHNLFLAFKEALHNAIKHAHATELRITLRIGPDSFALSVVDDGRGFAQRHEPNPTASNNGLDNMRSRMARIGGRCDIASEPGHGTRVTFILARPSGDTDGPEPASAG
ncbi:MAG TPA: two-component regulator propeller domain-containing protein [Opitutaceae bacterium]|nr:two-component regulator propeller domain-containing protein [Opitutaceae bacterium]